MTRFQNRAQAGALLARELKGRGRFGDVVVLGLARGGVPVALPVAEALNAPLDVFLVRKLGVPGREELAMGAIASGGIRVINEEIIRHLSIPEEDVARVAAREQEVLEARERAYRGRRGAPDLRKKTVILVDDGLATGASMKAAILAVREEGAERVVIAVPVGASSTCREMEQVADEVICVRAPSELGGVGAWYQDFGQTSDDEVRDCLGRIRQPGEAE
ncbi:MAG: phosphoribosyltransferase [Gemmatimonadota bacterium]